MSLAVSFAASLCKLSLISFSFSFFSFYFSKASASASTSPTSTCCHSASSEHTKPLNFLFVASQFATEQSSSSSSSRDLHPFDMLPSSFRIALFACVQAKLNFLNFRFNNTNNIGSSSSTAEATRKKKHEKPHLESCQNLGSVCQNPLT